MARLFAVLGAIAFVGSLLGFAWWYVWPSGTSASADAGPWSWRDSGPAILADVGLFTAFALHHSLLARSGAKAWIATIVPAALERSVYVWIASALFIAVYVGWRPVPGVAWAAGFVTPFCLAIQAAGAAMSLAAARRVGVLDLAGLAQVSGRARPPTQIHTNGLYAVVRHPVYFGWLLFVWASPMMTGSRLVFAATSTLYLLLAIPFEERDLRRQAGDAYARYLRHVRWRIVPFVY